LSDRRFIESAYAVLLRRPADETGIAHYLNALRAGRSRILVLGELRYSAEGRAVGMPVPGLRPRYVLQRLYRLPALGRILRMFTALAALPGVIRDSGRIWADVNAQRETIEKLQVELAGVRAQSSAAASTREASLLARIGQAEHAIRLTDERLHAVGRLIGEEPLADRMRQITDRHETIADRLDDLEKWTAEAGQRLNQAIDRLERTARSIQAEPWADPLLALADRQDALLDRLDHLQAALDKASGQGSTTEWLAGLLSACEQLSWPQDGGSFAQRIAGALTDDRNLAQRALNAVSDNTGILRDQERRLSLMLGEVRGWISNGPDANAIAALQEQEDHQLDSLYVAFEDRFRGSRADIKQRQRVYLDLLRQAGAGVPGRAIVDVGAGRGELLEMLGEAGLQARGVDLNQAMVAYCAQAGLDCTQGDAVAYLSAVEPGSLGAVTGFHIIEHLPFKTMVDLFDASLRALAPGGIVIFETPNPANLIVASRWFYLDPTHRNPLPGEMVAMIAEARGFVDVGIRELHPMDRRFEARDEVLAAQLDAIFFGPQDYALIARKA
jgi:2-polyprenyl-3-methyl-5-hydroxy-6-metoxy-1,4-benzoquinol methylase